MSKSLKYVSDFEFPSECGFSGSAGRTMVKGYARGGRSVMEKATGERYPSRSAMIKHEAEETPRMRREELIERSRVSRPAPPPRRAMPVAPREPMIAMKKGGATLSKPQQAKVGRVMGEYKAGELHSGSKSGPVVKSRDQAIAIALSEARKRGK